MKAVKARVVVTVLLKEYRVDVMDASRNIRQVIAQVLWKLDLTVHYCDSKLIVERACLAKHYSQTLTMGIS